jgi:hypothetical protein
MHKFVSNVVLMMNRLKITLKYHWFVSDIHLVKKTRFKITLTFYFSCLPKRQVCLSINYDPCPQYECGEYNVF